MKISNLNVTNNPCASYYYVDFTIEELRCTAIFDKPQQIVDWAFSIGVSTIKWDTSYTPCCEQELLTGEGSCCIVN